MISAVSNFTKYLATSGFPLISSLLDVSKIASNPVFIVGYAEYNVASWVGNILYTAINTFYYKYSVIKELLYLLYLG
jgi:hypothetical protein